MKTKPKPCAVIRAIYIAATAGAPMSQIYRVKAIVGQGLEGDRYVDGNGSWNMGKPGYRQVTLMNAHHIDPSDYDPRQVRRNIIVEGIDGKLFELNEFIGRYFYVGDVLFFAERYCTACDRPSGLSGEGRHATGFKEAFLDVGGVIANVIVGGEISAGSLITLMPREWQPEAQC